MADAAGGVALSFISERVFSKEVAWEQRYKDALRFLDDRPPGLVLASGLTASVFVLAAKTLHRQALLRIVEPPEEVKAWTASDKPPKEIAGVADGIVIDIKGSEPDVAAIFGSAPMAVCGQGAPFDRESAREEARRVAPPPRNASGAPLVKSGRPLVGMCGEASDLKGADIFLEVARALPEIDFLWMGDWGWDRRVEGLGRELRTSKELRNLYATGSNAYTYSYMSQIDLMFVSSRKEHSVQICREANALGIPVLCFSKTFPVGEDIGRYCIVCHGEPNVADTLRVLRACGRIHKADLYIKYDHGGFGDSSACEIVEFVDRIRGASRFV